MGILTTFTGLQTTTPDLFKAVTVTTEATAAAVTYTAAQVLGGLILRNTNGAGRADLLPTAASMFAAMESPIKNTSVSFEFTIRNTAGAAETITITTNTGLTLSGTMTIAQSNSKRFLWNQTSPTAATIYSLGTVVT